MRYYRVQVVGGYTISRVCVCVCVCVCCMNLKNFDLLFVFFFRAPPVSLCLLLY